MDPYRKARAQAPEGYFGWEAAGLDWLAEAMADGGAPVVGVREVGPHHLLLERLTSTRPDADAAHAFGAALARTHAAGAPAYGAGPPGWAGPGFFGPLAEPLPLALGAWATWGAFYAEGRLAPITALARDRGVLDRDRALVVDRLAERLHAGAFETGEPPARLHGDLWSGNVMWTPDGAVLIDPAAHGGHRETDLALLALFGAPHLDRIRAGYGEVSPLADGWADRVPLHQLHCLLVHAVLFGGGYSDRALAAARRSG